MTRSWYGLTAAWIAASGLRATSFVWGAFGTGKRCPRYRSPARSTVEFATRMRSLELTTTPARTRSSLSSRA